MAQMVDLIINKKADEFIQVFENKIAEKVRQSLEEEKIQVAKKLLKKNKKY